MQIASALASAEEVLQELRPAVVVVTGAADTALGTALAAAKLGIAVARVDAGLRARDWGEPAEVNRVLLDAMADSLFIASEYEAATLEQEGAGAGRVHLVGSTIADEMRRAERLAHGLDAWRRHELDRGGYVLVLLRHAARCGDDERLARMVEALALLARRTRWCSRCPRSCASGWSRWATSTGSRPPGRSASRRRGTWTSSRCSSAREPS